jgi:hypothetical protein
MSEEIIIVSGLPRSGTSLVMQMLLAGGLPVLTDKVRKPDKANPKGYYEHEIVKDLQNQPEIIREATGKAVKVISHLLQYLPPEYSYKVIFTRRNLDEVLDSQEKLLAHLKKSGSAERDHFKGIYLKHLNEVSKQLANRSNTDTLYLQYKEIITNPDSASQAIAQFLGQELDILQMQQVVDPVLYRNRREQDSNV